MCGAVRYEAEGQPPVVAHCHCEECQLGRGAGHASGAMFPVDRFRMTGRIAEYRYKSITGSELTRILFPRVAVPFLAAIETCWVVSPTLATLDNSSQFGPQVVVFARNRRSWNAMNGSLPSFETQPDWNPGDDV